MQQMNFNIFVKLFKTIVNMFVGLSICWMFNWNHGCFYIRFRKINWYLDCFIVNCGNEMDEYQCKDFFAKNAIFSLKFVGGGGAFLSSKGGGLIMFGPTCQTPHSLPLRAQKRSPSSQYFRQKIAFWLITHFDYQQTKRALFNFWNENNSWMNKFKFIPNLNVNLEWILICSFSYYFHNVQKKLMQ